MAYDLSLLSEAALAHPERKEASSSHAAEKKGN